MICEMPELSAVEAPFCISGSASGWMRVSTKARKSFFLKGRSTMCLKKQSSTGEMMNGASAVGCTEVRTQRSGLSRYEGTLRWSCVKNSGCLDMSAMKRTGF